MLAGIVMHAFRLFARHGKGSRLDRFALAFEGLNAFLHGGFGNAFEFFALGTREIEYVDLKCERIRAWREPNSAFSRAHRLHAAASGKGLWSRRADLNR